ncbi:hypothetical protein BDB00DRAFT_872703 [Zychaea mexicana]|uniref:uncharacterized protein n=1 Tax=Zychaea mexicana TaxID=64656 RepID=UPI0022FE17F0|nr:uncharacterized protein BDB00DRAFT_872703 [Zychaea mexicana]KAI9493187.1 hypothetical protein BDB00DRAFT_872703 [Zychaea mexicana]
MRHLRAPSMEVHVNHLMHDALARYTRLPYITVNSMAGPALGGGTGIITAFDYVCIASTPYHQSQKALLIFGSAPKVDSAMAKELGLADVVMISTTTAMMTRDADISYMMSASKQARRSSLTTEPMSA